MNRWQHKYARWYPTADHAARVDAWKLRPEAIPFEGREDVVPEDEYLNMVAALSGGQVAPGDWHLPAIDDASAAGASRLRAGAEGGAARATAPAPQPGTPRVTATRDDESLHRLDAAIGLGEHLLTELRILRAGLMPSKRA